MKTRGVLKLLFVGIAVSALFAITPAFSDEGKDESGKGREQRHFSPKQHGSNDNRATYFQRHGYTRLNIPAGHYPRRANAASGFRTVRRGSSLPQETAIRSRLVHG
jgi:hypothetical protein